MPTFTIHQGSNLDILPTLPDNSVDSIVTDPPYELGFMGKAWDSTGIAYNVQVWKECMRVLKHGGHLIAFGGSRTYHRMAVAIEDAGFEIRDQMMWVYGSGFPKSHNISKALDKNAGVKRTEVIGIRERNVKPFDDANGWNSNNTTGNYEYTAPATPEAKQWDGWGTALKPAHEPIVLARKPIDGTIADNVLKWGVGGLNIDGCRVEALGENFDNVKDRTDMTGKLTIHHEGGNLEALDKLKRLGRFPANFMHDGSQEVLDLFPESKTSRVEKPSNCKIEGVTNFNSMRGNRPSRGYDEQGSAARFFYCPKANKKDRDEGCEDFEEKTMGKNQPSFDGGQMLTGSGNERSNTRKNTHPTVKPTELMRYLCRLITPPNGTVLDPFNGSGSTGKGAILEGFNYIGIELDPEYIKISEARIKAVL